MPSDTYLSNGSKTYYHQMLSAVLVHPDKKEVIPLAPELIFETPNTLLIISMRQVDYWLFFTIAQQAIKSDINQK